MPKRSGSRYYHLGVDNVQRPLCWRPGRQGLFAEVRDIEKVTCPECLQIIAGNRVAGGFEPPKKSRRSAL